MAQVVGLVLHLAVSGLVAYIGFKTDRNLWRLCVAWPLRLASAVSFGSYIALPALVAVSGPTAYSILIPAVLALVWSTWIAPRFGATARRFRLSVAYRRLYALLDEERSEARTEAALATIRSLDSLHGTDKDRLARLMQSSFHESLIKRTIPDEELDRQVAEVNAGVRDLAC